jgi:hypothetical protein
VNCDVVGLLTLYDVLRFALRRVVHIAFETNIGGNFPNDHTANSSGFGIPFNMVTALERLSHRAGAILNESRVIIQARKHDGPWFGPLPREHELCNVRWFKSSPRNQSHRLFPKDELAIQGLSSQ